MVGRVYSAGLNPEFPADELSASVIYLFSRQRCTRRNTCRESGLTAAPHFISKLCEPPFGPEESLAFASHVSCFKRRFEAAQLFGAPPRSMSSVLGPQQELRQPCKRIASICFTQTGSFVLWYCKPD